MSELNLALKIQKVSVELQKKDIKKSGFNKHSKFNYFQLDDFLPTLNDLLFENGLFAYCKFDKETAYLVVTDGHSEFISTSPMPQNFKTLPSGSDIQHIGAIETYQRRYLYLATFGIVQSEIVDNLNQEEITQKMAEEQQQPTSQRMCRKQDLDDLLKRIKHEAQLISITPEDYCKSKGIKLSDLKMPLSMDKMAEIYNKVGK